MPRALNEYPPGIVLWIVINNKEFESSSYKEREGAEVDANNLQNALQPFKVELRIWENYKRQNILNALRALCEEVDREPNKFSGLVILGASHGEECDNRDYLVASDGKGLLTETIVALFHNDARVGLKDRPKCYLFNMCRGANANVQIQQDGSGFHALVDHANNCYLFDSQNNAQCCNFNFSEGSKLELEEDAKRIHCELMSNDCNGSVLPISKNEDHDIDNDVISFKKGDYMIVHSTLRGYVSNRHKYLGTIFVQELTKSIKEMMRQESHNFEEVIRRACFAASKHQSSGENAPQVPEFITTLRAPFRFVLKEEYKVEKILGENILDSNSEEKMHDGNIEKEENQRGLSSWKKVLFGTTKRKVSTILGAIGIIACIILVTTIPLQPPEDVFTSPEPTHSTFITSLQPESTFFTTTLVPSTVTSPQSTFTTKPITSTTTPEICQFKKDYVISGDFDKLDDYDIKEQCAIMVKNEFPNATGVIWRDSSNFCAAAYGNNLYYYGDNFNGYYSCLFEGKAFWEFTRLGICVDGEEVISTVSQLDCQDSCRKNSSCVGISYQNGVSNAADCFTCNNGILKQSSVYAFYSKPESCIENSNCQVETPICNINGYCYKCADDGACTDPDLPFCINGFCSECKTNSDCGTTSLTCIEGACQEFDFITIDDQSCSPRYADFGSKSAAKDACKVDIGCKGVMVYWRGSSEEDEFEEISLCRNGCAYSHDSHSTVYEKYVSECRNDIDCKYYDLPYCYSSTCVECYLNGHCDEGQHCNTVDNTCESIFVIDCESPFEVLTIPGATIISPNYPNDYESGLDCEVTIIFEERVLIEFQDFELEGKSSMPFEYSCKDDWLEIHDGNSSDSELIVNRLCGWDIPSNPFDSTGNSMTLVFHSDRFHNYKGFKIKTSQTTNYQNDMI